MKKKLLQIILLVLSFVSILAIKPIISKAEETPVTTNKSAIDASSQQLLDGTGYFKKTNYSSQYTFYYTNYNGTDVDYTTNESLYVRTINKSVIPTSWYNESTGLDLETYESISIIQGKWALPKEYVTDFNGNIIPNSTGYLQESVYSDCRRYVYYITYKNEDGVQRPVFDKHYECDIEVEKIPDYLLSANGKNEKMGVLYGGIFDTDITKVKAIRNIYYYEEVHYGSLDLDSSNPDMYLYPIIYFNIEEVDYDELLSVKFSYVIREHKKNWLGIFTDEILKTYNFEDELFFDETLEYTEKYTTFWDYLALAGSSSDTAFVSYVQVSEYYTTLRSDGQSDKLNYKALQSGSWIKESNVNGTTANIEYKNRMVGHLTDLSLEKDILERGKKKYDLAPSSVKFLKVTYVYDGVLYITDDNVEINGIDLTPEDSYLHQNTFDDFLDKLLESFGNVSSTVVNSINDGFLSFLTAFFSNLSPTVWVIIVIVVLMLLIIVTKPLWQVLVTDKILKKPQLVDQSFKMQNRQAYYKSQRQQRRQLRRDRRAARKERRYYEKQYQNRRKDTLSDREYLSNRVDKKYEHEEYLANKKAEGYTVQHRHNNYTVTHKLAGNKNGKEIKKTASWYPDYLKKEKEKMKYNQKTGEVSDESLEDLEKFFKTQNKK